MSSEHHERLSALDAAMVFTESPAIHMHVGVVGIFEAGPLATADGAVDIERIRAHVAGVLDDVPRFRQRLTFTPIEGHPVWVDDARFNLAYHVHHLALPHPGDDRQLKRLTGRIMSQKIDLSKPPWEMWVIEGLAGGRFAAVSKMHHCMVDGIAAVVALSAFFSTEPQAPAHGPSHWKPRPAPSAAALAAAEVRRLGSAPLGLARGAAAACADPGGSLRALRDLAAGAADVARGKTQPAPRTPLNPDTIGPHRRVDWIRLDLDRARQVKSRLGVKLNDVVLAAVAGAVRHYLRERRVPLGELDFQVVVPVNTRTRTGPGQSAPGNRVVPLLARLPLEQHDAGRRLHAIAATTRSLKESNQIEALAAFEDLSSWANAALLSALVQRTARWWTGNLTVTNVPGPPFPFYMLGARVLECYPLIPILATQAVSIAVLSYAGGLHWGFNADWDAVPELHELVELVATELDDLAGLAEPGSTAAGAAPR